MKQRLSRARVDAREVWDASNNLDKLTVALSLVLIAFAAFDLSTNSFNVWALIVIMISAASIINGVGVVMLRMAVDSYERTATDALETNENLIAIMKKLIR